jgi:hypothetical protein
MRIKPEYEVSMTLNVPSPQEEKKRPSRLGLYLPFAALALIIAGWSLFWFITAEAADQIIDNVLQRESSRGRDWSCPNRVLGGFPFRIEIRCDAPRLALRRADGRVEQASLGGLVIHARILSPRHFIAIAAPPFRIREDAPEPLTLAWESARMSFEAGQASLTEAAIEITNPTFSTGKADKQQQQAKAKSFTLHMRQSAVSAPGTDLVTKVTDLSAPVLDLLAGSGEPVQAEFQASAPGLTLTPEADIRTRLEAWRMAQGKARILVAKVSKGAFALDLAGELGLDAAKRLEGNLQGRARGFDAIMGRLTRQNGLDMGNLLGKLSGGQGMPVVLTFEGGKLRYGPFQLANLAPLY